MDKDGFFWHRFMLSSNLQFGKRVELFAELKSDLTTSRDGGNRPSIDYNELDFHQLFLQIMVWQNSRSNIKVKVGRQEYQFGSQRLFTSREGPNNRLSFNGATINYQNKYNTLTTFIAQPVNNNLYIFDDNAVPSQTVWGANLTHQQPGSLSKWELYYYGSSNQKIILAGIPGKDIRQSAGFFWLTDTKDWKIEFEPVLHFGQFNTRSIFAYSFYSNITKKSRPEKRV